MENVDIKKDSTKIYLVELKNVKDISISINGKHKKTVGMFSKRWNTSYQEAEVVLTESAI